MTTFAYQRTGTFFAQVAGGFEALAAAELAALGATALVPGFRGLRFKADPATLYRVNYQARLVMRVLAPLATFDCRDRDDLYRAGRAVDWPALFSERQTFGIVANVSGNPNLRHSKFGALCLKDAVADAFRAESGRRPNVDRFDPDIWLNLHIEKTQATISLDTSGGPLHRRGYRRQSVEAPMQETLAAAMLTLAEWDGETPLYDPMCGSGTLLCEALMSVCRIPAGFLRPRFGFFRLPDFDASLWARVKQGADDAIRPLPPGRVAGSDIEAQAVKAARVNCGLLPGGGQVAITRRDVRDLESLENRIIVCNPPYGRRLQADTELAAFYRSLGDFLKQRCKGSQAFIYFGNREMLKKIGLRPAWKKELNNAGIDGRVAKYELY